MKYKIIIFSLVLIVFASLSIAEDLFEKDVESETLSVESISADIYSDIKEVKLQESAGITPDSMFYFVEDFLEGLQSDNPDMALQYKEEKIAEVREMIKAGKIGPAKKALQRAGKYGKILQKEVTPELQLRARESSKAVKNVLQDLEDDIDKLEGNEDVSSTDMVEVRVLVEEQNEQQDKIALAAQSSSRISELCKQLAELDPLEYSNVCKTDDDAPKWKQNLDRELTATQKKEAKEFFSVMSECFRNPNACRCDDISIIPFAEKCKVIAPLAAKCEKGDEDACNEMESIEDPMDLLPDYLRDVMEDLEDDYGDSKHDLHVPKECAEAGATDRKSCSKIMFKLHAPEECVKAAEAGKINMKNEREAKKACEKIMFEIDAPEECIKAGINDRKKCDQYIFRLDAPEECLELGITGEGRDDWKRCDVIRFKMEAPQECLDAGLTGEGRDDWKKCDLIRFKMDAPQECIDAGITGEKRDDWKKCDAIKFKMDAHPACLEAGITGAGRDEWKK